MTERSNTAERIQRHRNALRAGFAEECRRQSLLFIDDQHEVDTLRWLDRVADRDDWT